MVVDQLKGALCNAITRVLDAADKAVPEPRPLTAVIPPDAPDHSIHASPHSAFPMMSYFAPTAHSSDEGLYILCNAVTYAIFFIQLGTQVSTFIFDTLKVWCLASRAVRVVSFAMLTIIVINSAFALQDLRITLMPASVETEAIQSPFRHRY